MNMLQTTRNPVRNQHNLDPWMEHAKEVILADFGETVSLVAKNKDLIKYGRNQDVETAIATLMTLPDSIDNETYVSTNIITTIISSSASDTNTVQVEGHTISGSDLTFVVQSATLNGQTAVTLTTALARCTRVFNTSATDHVGQIAVTEDDTFTSGVPDTDAKVHLLVRTGENQSEKAATALSSVDYWVITHMNCDMLTKAASFAEVDLEIRLESKVFRPIVDISCSDSHAGLVTFAPYVIVPPNSDVRLRGISDSASGRDVGGEIHGSLLKA